MYFTMHFPAKGEENIIELDGKTKKNLLLIKIRYKGKLKIGWLLT